MAVNFTPNLGLAKPTGVEKARKWVDVDTPGKLADLNNTLLNDNVLSQPLLSYTPELINSAGSLVLGSGNVKAGRYMYLPAPVSIPRFVMGWFSFQVTGTVNVVAGDYIATLPTLVDLAFHLDVGDGVAITEVIGEGKIKDDSSQANSMNVAMLLRDNTGGVGRALFFLETYTGKGVNDDFMFAGVPFTLASGDRIAGNFLYKAG